MWCSWWGRHYFTSPLNPLHLALRRTVLRGSQSAIGDSTIVAAYPYSYLLDPAVTPQCKAAWDSDDEKEVSWSGSATSSIYQSLFVSLTPSHHSFTKSSKRTLSPSRFATATAAQTPSGSSSIAFSGTKPRRTKSITVTLPSPATLSLTPSGDEKTVSVESSTYSTDTVALSGTTTVSPMKTLTFELNLTVSHVVSVTSSLGRTDSKSHKHTSSVLLSLTPSLVPLLLVGAATPPPIVAAAFVSVATAVSGGAVGDAATIATLTMMTCTGKTTWDSNTGPQRLVVSIFYDLGPAASFLGNTGLAALFYILPRSIVRIVHRRSSRRSGGLRDSVATVAGKVGFPSMSWSVSLFLLPGMFFSAMLLVSTEDDLVIGASVAGRVVFSTIGCVLVCSVFAVASRVMAVAAWPRVHTASAHTTLREPFLPNWMMRCFGPWLLPHRAWKPNALKLQYNDFFSSVASKDALWVHPFLQMHGAVFSLIAAIPFPESVCMAQFGLAIAWTCVPIALLVRWRLRLFRRPPLNALCFVSHLCVVAMLVASLIAQNSSNTSEVISDVIVAQSVLSWILAVVSAAKVVITLTIAFAEHRAKIEFRRFHRRLRLHSENNRLSGENFELLWKKTDQNEEAQQATDEQIDNQLLSEPPYENAADSGTNLVEIVSRTYSYRFLKGALNIATLDAQIEQVVSDTALLSSGGKFASNVAGEQQLQLQKFVLKLLIVRAARGVAGVERPQVCERK